MQNRKKKKKKMYYVGIPKCCQILYHVWPVLTPRKIQQKEKRPITQYYRREGKPVARFSIGSSSFGWKICLCEAYGRSGLPSGKNCCKQQPDPEQSYSSNWTRAWESETPPTLCTPSAPSFASPYGLGTREQLPDVKSGYGSRYHCLLFGYGAQKKRKKTSGFIYKKILHITNANKKMS